MNKNNDIRVVRVLDEYTVAINKGAKDGIKLGQKFLIYELDKKPIIDPITREELGILEIVKGKAKVTHIQERMATLTSIEQAPATKRVTKNRPSILSDYQQTQEEIEPGDPLPFERPWEGDLAKPI